MVGGDYLSYNRPHPMVLIVRPINENLNGITA